MIQNYSPNPSNQNTDLPIIHKLIEAYKLWQEYLQYFPKTSRYLLGSKIDSAFIETTELIFISCSLGGENKLAYLLKSSVKLDLLKFFLRISWEIKAIDNKKYAVLSEQLNEIGKMLGGWMRQLKEKLPTKTEEQR